MCIKGKKRDGKGKGKNDWVCKKCGCSSDNPFELCKAKPAAGMFGKKGKSKK